MHVTLTGFASIDGLLRTGGSPSCFSLASWAVLTGWRAAATLSAAGSPVPAGRTNLPPLRRQRALGPLMPGPEGAPTLDVRGRVWAGR